MTQMHRKVQDESGRRVLRAVSAIERFTPRLIEAMDRTLAPDGWDVSAACVEAVHRSLIRVMESRLETLRRAVDERRLVAQKGKRLRRDRDRAAREVYELLVRLRNMVRGLGGTVAERALFDPGKTPREAKPLALAAWELSQRVRSEMTRDDLCRRFGGEAVLEGWLAEVAEPLSRLFELLDQVRLLEQDEAAAVHEVRQAREGMGRVEQHALRILEDFYELAELPGLAGRIRLREPEAREAETSASEAVETAGEATGDPQGPVPAAGEAIPVPATSRRPSAPGDAEGVAQRDPGVGESATEPRVEVAAAATQELPPGRRPGGEATPESAGTAPPEASKIPGPGPTTHPVRKVLKWLRVVPHPVETPEDKASPAVPREDAA